MNLIPDIDDRLRKFVDEFVSPEKKGEALQILKNIKSDTITTIVHKVTKGINSITLDIETHEEK